MSLDITLYAIPKEPQVVFDLNITHNLGQMAIECGLYEFMWEAEDKVAFELISGLEKGIQELESNPGKYKEFNPSNGWGTYENLLACAKGLLEACKENPNATISCSR